MKGLLSLVVICSIGSMEGYIQRPLDSLHEDLARRDVIDTALVDLRNDYLRQRLLANPTDTTLLAFANETLEIAGAIRYARGTLLAYERLGLVYQYALGDPYRALEYYQQAMQLAESEDVLASYQAGIIGNIGNIYYEQEEYGKALNYFRRVLAFQNDMELAATANIGNIYGNLQQNDSAAYYLKRAISLARETSNWVFLANGLCSLSLVYVHLGETHAAQEAIEESLALIEQHQIGFVRTTAYINAAMVYLAGHDLVHAERFASDALKMDGALNNATVQKAAWATLADVYAAQHRYKDALEAYKRYDAFQDSLTSQNRRVEINRRQLQYDFEKQKALAQAEIRRQTTIRNASLLGGGVLLVIGILGFILYKRRRDIVVQKQDAEFKALVADTELKALRAQLNPHFIFNSLNSISDYIAKSDIESAQEYLTQFAQLMRQTLENSDRKEISLAADLLFMELYLKVEAKRLSDKFSYRIDVDEAIDIDNTLVPPMLLQPLIENSIWHGMARKEGKGHIHIAFRKAGETLICSVDDDGVGRRTEDVAKASKRSFGLRLTEARLAILNKQKNVQGRLDIIDKTEGGGVFTEVRLPLQLAF